MKFDISEYKESVKLLCQELKKNVIDRASGDVCT